MNFKHGARFATVAAIAFWIAAPAAAQDQPPYECDDNFGECGTPQQSGGGGGGGGGSILVNNTDLGDTYQYADDYDSDGVEDPYDLCPWDYDPDQIDDDGDGVGTQCDNCPSSPNLDQANLDGDLMGDACDADLDGDGIANAIDLCIQAPDPFQRDTDGDSIGDACDADMDNDGVANLADNCPLVHNPDQLNGDPDYWGDACDEDDDGDGIRNTYDNCIAIANGSQDNLDGDLFGDLCDADVDGDDIINADDNCPELANADQIDLDRDGVGELCDDRYCYVVDGDFDNCLDPTDPFSVYVPSMELNTGDEVRLRLFANQINQPLRYTFVIDEAPRGSKATIDNPVGASSVSTPYEYHYLADRLVSFTPDEPGEYVVHVYAELAFEDRVTGEAGTTAEATAILTVIGARTGCNTVPVPPAGWWLAFPLLLGLRRRKA